MSTPGVVPQPQPQQQQPPPPSATPPATPEVAPPLPEPQGTAETSGAAAGQSTAPPAAAASDAAGTAAQVVLTVPGTEFRIGNGPYTVPVSVSNAPRVSTLSLSITYDPAVVRVRSVQEGSFMRQGGVAATFTRQVDDTGGRVDITVARGQDLVGASGSGLVAALLVEPVAAGSASFAVSGAGTGPAGSLVSLRSSPVTVTVR